MICRTSLRTSNCFFYNYRLVRDNGAARGFYVNMDSVTVSMSSDGHPVLLLPKTCTTLETNCELSDNVFIELKITSPGSEGNEICIYTGFCNVKVVDSHDVNISQNTSREVAPNAYNENDFIPVVVDESGNQIGEAYNQSQVWIDPARSPYVYNNDSESAHYPIHHNTQTNHITFEQHNTYITQNVYNCNEPVPSTSRDEFEHKKFRKVHASESSTQHLVEANMNFYEEEEFECGVFLSQLQEEILNESKNRAREERKYIGISSDNGALKQLMSFDVQTSTKQRKTILFLGHGSHYGQTIQKITMNDPYLVCSVKDEVTQTVYAEPNYARLNHKRYQCDKCKQIFDEIIEFRRHMMGGSMSPQTDGENVKFLCTECGKNIRSQKKFEQHCLSHGDPNLQCTKCHKVFASKFTLRAHSKIHNRKYGCVRCTKTFWRESGLRTHAAKIHNIYMCENCDFECNNKSELREHATVHKELVPSYVDSWAALEDTSESDIITLPNECAIEMKDAQDEDVRRDDADSVIEKVVTNEFFAAKGKKFRKCDKRCDVCQKVFDRIGDLKRHLIEHIVKSTFDKIPVSRDGTLAIRCAVCKTETFTRVDRYKAHLRDHAKLTIYKCSLCDKSFSDSSNFSKHKKIHGLTFLQCDVCGRKFNSKRMLIPHLEYHMNNAPIPCQFCKRLFHFESTLNKHIKTVHSYTLNKMKCRFCCTFFKTLKEKWDHEWTVHNVRKLIVDCLMCNAKFRKYTELKNHCYLVHKMDIPTAKKLFPKT